MKKYLDTINQNEWVKPPKHIGPPPEGVIEAPADCPYFKPVPTGKRITWASGMPELEDIPEKTPEEIEAERIASRKTYSPKQFIERFTQDEINTFKTLSEINPNVWTWLMVLTGADYVDLLDPLVQDAMAWFVYQGHITQARHDEIMMLEFEQ